jgi:hypothetical protein
MTRDQKVGTILTFALGGWCRCRCCFTPCTQSRRGTSRGYCRRGQRWSRTGYLRGKDSARLEHAKMGCSLSPMQESLYAFPNCIFRVSRSVPGEKTSSSPERRKEDLPEVP